jgi:hypothetical protein
LGGTEGVPGEGLTLVPDAELRAHVAGCAGCREEFEAQRRLLAAIDHGLAERLREEPSPEFAVRVRQRLAGEPVVARSWFHGWLPAAAGALAVLALVAVWLARRQPHEAGTTEQTARITHPQTAPDVVAALAGSQRATGQHGKRAVSAGGTRRGIRAMQARATAPEVLVPPGQEESILQFYAAARSGLADLSSLFRESTSSEPEELKLKILPLEVAPLEAEARPSEPGKGR